MSWLQKSMNYTQHKLAEFMMAKRDASHAPPFLNLPFLRIVSVKKLSDTGISEQKSRTNFMSTAM